MRRALGVRVELLRALRREEGQSIVLVTICLVVFLAMAGLVIDVGQMYVTQRHLQTAADAAALAAAQDLPGSTASACQFSGSPRGTTTCTINGTNLSMAADGSNYSSSFGNVQTTGQLECLSVASAGISCQTGPACPANVYLPPVNSGSNVQAGCNAIKITEHTKVTPYFLGVLGIGARDVSATSTAGIAGGTPRPFDIEVVADSTASMQDHCSSPVTGIPNGQSGPYVSGGTPTKLDCAKAGVKALLGSLMPCSVELASCGPATGTDVNNPLDRVGLMTFPGINPGSYPADSKGVVPEETDCFKNFANPTYAANANYQVVPLSSDFRTSDTAAALSPSSPLVNTITWDSCPNSTYPTGGGTQSGSISGGGPADTTTAKTNGGQAIGGGPGVSGYNSAVSTGATTATSISVPVPAKEAAGTLVVVSVVTQGQRGATICATSGGTWSASPAASQSGVNGNRVTLVTFESVRTTSDTGSYAFSFHGAGSCNGASRAVNASAVAVVYTGADSVDVSSGTVAASMSSTVTAPGVSPSSSGDRVVRVYASGSTAFTGTQTFTNGVAGGKTVAGAGTLLGVVDGSQTGQTSATTSAQGYWVGNTIALQPAQAASSISVSRPATTVGGDFVAVAVTANGLGSGRICAPVDNNYGWQTIRQDSGNGSISQAIFYSFRGDVSTDPGPWSFTFTKGPTCSDQPATVSATALAVRYSGVSPVATVDAQNGGLGTGTQPTPPSVTTGFVNDAVIRFYGSGATSISGDSVTASGITTSTGFNTAIQGSPGQTGNGPNVSTSNDDWAADTIAVRAADPGCSGDCTYGLEDPGGVSTYYASAIDAAQTALTGPQGRTDAQRVIIILSDGDANTNVHGPNACHQGITSAENAETPQSDGSTTWVFAIAYNANATGGCSTDTGSNSITALCAMHVIADNYVTDPAASAGNPKAVCGNNATNADHRFYNQPADGDLTTIFKSIGTTLTSARLVSNDAS